VTGYDPIPWIQSVGYTEREASFLYLVAVHSGYFLRRQFDRFIDRHSGAIAQHFLRKARWMGHVVALDFGQHRHVYHLSHKNFYTVLEAPDSQNRRRKSDGEIKLRLMTLDYVLSHLDENFLDSPETKAQFFTEELGIPQKDLPRSGRYSQQPFADRVLIVCEEGRKPPRFIFLDESMRSMARFEKFLCDYQRLFQALAGFELIYLADADTNFSAATRLFGKSFPQSRTPNAHALYPKGAGHLLAWFRVRARYDAGTGGLTMEDFLLLREGNRLYTVPVYSELYAGWRAKPCEADGLRNRISGNSSPISFRTELLELTYPIFTYRHLPRKAPVIGSIERSPLRPPA
jgi:hypothetical protein